MIEDVFSKAGGPANLVLPGQPGPIHGKTEVNRDSDLRPSNPGLMARPGHRADTFPNGASTRLALGTDTNGVLKVRGFAELTAYNCGLLRTGISAALNGHLSIEIDLSRTTVMDCAGLGTLIALRNCALRRNGVVRLVSPTPAVRRLFEIVRAEQMFEIVHPVGLHPIAPEQPRVSVPVVTEPENQ